MPAVELSRIFPESATLALRFLGIGQEEMRHEVSGARVQGDSVWSHPICM